MTEPVFKRYQESDRSDCLAILESNSPEYFTEVDRVEFERFLDRLPGEYLICCVGDRVVGCGGWAENDDGSCALTWGMIHGSLHQQGLGSRLLGERLRRAQQAGHSLFRIETTPDVAPFFERVGFRATEKEKDGFAPGFDRWVMFTQEPD